MAEWTFYDYVEPSGRNYFDEWLTSLPDDARGHIEEKITYLESRRQWNEKLAKLYKGREGIFEFRPTFKHVPYRPLMCRHPTNPKGFVFLEGARENNWKIQKSHLDSAERRRDELIKDPSRAQLR